MKFAAFALFASVLLLGAAKLHAKEATSVTIEIRGERVTLQAKDAPLALILERLAKSAGIVVYIREPLEDRVSVDLTEVTIEDGLQQLLKDRNTLFLYDKYPGVPTAIYVLGSRPGTIPPGISGWRDVASTAFEPEEDPEVEAYQTEMLKVAQEIEAIDRELRDVSEVRSPGVSRLLQNLMADQEPGVRITALHWLADRQGSEIAALTTALQDIDYSVQTVAVELLLDRGVSEKVVEELREAAETKDEAAIRQLLSSVLSL
jgi:hypothetical protein